MNTQEDAGKRKISFFSKIPPQYTFITLVFILGMLLTSLFRLILVLQNLDQVKTIPYNILIYAFTNRGGLFDASVTSYIILFPFIFLSLGYFIRPARKWFNYIAIFLLWAFFIWAIAIYSTDIPFFAYFNSRLTNSILNWTEDIGLMIKSRFSTLTYYPYVALFLVLAVGFCIIIKKIANRTILAQQKTENKIHTKIILFLVMGFIIFNGIRGNLNYKVYPLRTADSFFSKYSFANQLGLNPLFTFFDSYKDKQPKILDDKEAVQLAQKYLNVKQKYESPLARDVNFDSISSKPNAVIFIVESLSAYQMQRYGNKKNFMPFLDSLAKVSAVFDNAYTAGMHTYNGVFSTLFSFPSILNTKPFSSTEVNGQKMSGAPNVLHQSGYKTMFFCSGDKQFDNMNSFLSSNDFDRLYSQDDYPKDEERTEWGVHDEVMFNYVIPVLTDEASKGKPFLAVILTITTHESLSLPKKTEFKTSVTDAYEKQFEYTDWAFSKFFENASKQNWFKNTVFAIIGDHGQNFDPTYDVPLSYVHSPMIFYSPGIIKPQAYQNFGLQIDLFPTLMGFLRIPYINNTFGIDLTREKRPYSYFTSDDKFGCINENYYLIIRPTGMDGLYRYRQKDLTNCIGDNKTLADSMKTYTYSMIQTANWMIKHKMLSLPEIREY